MALDTNEYVDLVKTPFEMTHILTNHDLIMPIDSIIDSTALMALHDEYFLLDLVKTKEQLYFMPRKFETRMILYLKSKVKLAVENWKIHETRY